MPNEEDDRDPMLDEEHPGPQVLESALANTTLSEVTGLPPLTVLETTTVGDAVRLMQRERRACVLVVEDRRLIGIFTERDILMKVVAHPIDVERTP
ncbi:MAG: 2-oxoglutarate oxidoreductase subunit KorB, partial [Candidatus Binatus sp.]|nr:2-oxoglutarate oxidoreductase subunit KorB [Candidatus Binatus sp.]